MLAQVALPLPLNNLFTYAVPERFVSHVQVGQQVLVPFRNRLLNGVVVHLNGAAFADAPAQSGESRFSVSSLKEIHAILNPNFPFPEHLLSLTQWMSEKYGCSWGETLAVVSSSWGRIRQFSYQDVTRKQSDSILKEFHDSYSNTTPPYSLTPEQVDAARTIQESFRDGDSKTFLLFGVTSSGKTEVYLNAIGGVVHHSAPPQRKQALFLVPEISLCPAFFDILTQRFGGRVGMWHSQMTRKEKNQLVEEMYKGDVNILVGARSALFAPFFNLGVIIVDEEHDASYKQQEKPRYHAREVALKLAAMHRAVLVLGSATPSLESFYRAEKKEFILLKLLNRIPIHSIPTVALVDKKRSPQHRSLFSEKLTQAIAIALSKREQVILALNRRGYSTYLFCHACGFVFKCSSCQLAFVHHQASETIERKDFLRCHYCFKTRSLPNQCEKCRSLSIFLGGAGTQKIVQEIKRLFPYARVLRLDRDIAGKKALRAKTYQTFKNESADILVGTKMVTQGFDFPRVTLVGIIDADTALCHPDFRAAEKTFQWICQAAGRAGRSPMGGAVYVQSCLPEHYALQTSCTLDFELFYKQEVEFRRALFFPPFSKLVLFRIESRSKKQLVPKESERLAARFKEGTDIKILGPGPSPREVLRGQLRWQILLKCANEEGVLEIVRLGRSFIPEPGVRVVIDVDPYDVL